MNLLQSAESIHSSQSVIENVTQFPSPARVLSRSTNNTRYSHLLPVNVDSTGDGGRSTVIQAGGNNVSSTVSPAMVSTSVCDVAYSSQTVQQKLQWATRELASCNSVEYSIQLCHLIKTCADTIAALSQVESITK